MNEHHIQDVNCCPRAAYSRRPTHIAGFFAEFELNGILLSRPGWCMNRAQRNDSKGCSTSKDLIANVAKAVVRIGSEKKTLGRSVFPQVHDTLRAHQP